MPLKTPAEFVLIITFFFGVELTLKIGLKFWIRYRDKSNTTNHRAYMPIHARYLYVV